MDQLMRTVYYAAPTDESETAGSDIQGVKLKPDNQCRHENGSEEVPTASGGASESLTLNNSQTISYEEAGLNICTAATDFPATAATDFSFTTGTSDSPYEHKNKICSSIHGSTETVHEQKLFKDTTSETDMLKLKVEVLTQNVRELEAKLRKEIYRNNILEEKYQNNNKKKSALRSSNNHYQKALIMHQRQLQYIFLKFPDVPKVIRHTLENSDRSKQDDEPINLESSLLKSFSRNWMLPSHDKESNSSLISLTTACLDMSSPEIVEDRRKKVFPNDSSEVPLKSVEEKENGPHGPKTGYKGTLDIPLFQLQGFCLSIPIRPPMLARQYYLRSQVLEKQVATLKKFINSQNCRIQKMMITVDRCEERRRKYRAKLDLMTSKLIVSQKNLLYNTAMKSRSAKGPSGDVSGHSFENHQNFLEEQLVVKNYENNKLSSVNRSLRERLNSIYAALLELTELPAFESNFSLSVKFSEILSKFNDSSTLEETANELLTENKSQQVSRTRHVNRSHHNNRRKSAKDILSSTSSQVTILSRRSRRARSVCIVPPFIKYRCGIYHTPNDHGFMSACTGRTQLMSCSIHDHITTPQFASMNGWTQKNTKIKRSSKPSFSNISRESKIVRNHGDKPLKSGSHYAMDTSDIYKYCNEDIHNVKSCLLNNNENYYGKRMTRSSTSRKKTCQVSQVPDFQKGSKLGSASPFYGKGTPLGSMVTNICQLMRRKDSNSVENTNP